MSRRFGVFAAITTWGSAEEGCVRWSKGNDYESFIIKPTEAQSSHFISD